MRRDWDLIREILLALESNTARETLQSLPGRADADVHYHIALLVEQDFVEGFVSAEVGSEIPQAQAFSLKSKGHDFLDAVREESVWERATGDLKRKGIAFTFEVLKSAAITVAAETAKRALGME